ncbi:MAG: 16S rRNA (cytosine(967)-C(5))-methyltransferase RsmB [Clostridia bacterium]|nr:16S rRNA (cytosine(967)-C(5))-methyltransferase RsmB [Clostridia bacterium]
MNARELALSVLQKAKAAEQYSNIAVDTALTRCSLSSADKGLFTALVYGVIERRLTLDACIEAFSDRPLESLDPQTRTILQLGIYQLAFLDRIPDHAAVNETVALAPRRTRGFINAVLRAFLRAEKRIPYPDPEADPIRYLSVRYSFLPEICELFMSVYGFERTESLLAAFCRQAPLTLRVNTLRTTRQTLMDRLSEQGYDPKSCAESPDGILLSAGSPTAMEGFDAGEFFVQDEASQLCVRALDVQSGMTVIDTCACPGSKSFGIAIEMKNDGRVICCDLHANKLSLIREGADRLRISVITCQARDARTEAPDWEGIADRVLCDVPCSGFGVFAKKPELRYKNPKMSEGLPQIQLDILRTSSRLVKVGGRLVYSTCTLLPCENGEVVSAFLKEHPSFALLRERTLYPDQDHTDGFYFAVLERNA